jgi:hypothetical protein
MSSGDVPLDETGEAKAAQASYEYTRPYRRAQVEGGDPETR